MCLLICWDYADSGVEMALCEIGATMHGNVCVARHAKGGAKYPLFPTRGLMLDLGRIIEKRSYYVSLLPWLAEWGYNLVHLHLADDQMCSMRFPSRPELASPGAYTADEMRDLVKTAAGYGISVMPEIETLGHSRFITGRKEHRHLAEPARDNSGFNALCPSSPAVREILADLIRDIAAIFDYPVIHVGLDEVQFGDCAACRNNFGRVADWRRFAEHSAWVHAQVRISGRRPAMWADGVVNQIETLRFFKRDVEMYYWDYSSEYRAERIKPLLDAGFKVISCPSILCTTSRILPNATTNLKNLRNASARALCQIEQGVAGVVNTIWCPWRYLSGAVDFGIALGGHLASVGKEDPGFAGRFAERFYGVRNPGRLAAAINDLHNLSPDKNTHDRIVYGADNFNCRYNREDARESEELMPRIARVLDALRISEVRIDRNRDRFHDVVLSAEVILAMARFGAYGRRRSTVKNASGLYRRVKTAWERDRQSWGSYRFGDWSGGRDALLRSVGVYCSVERRTGKGRPLPR